MMALYAVYSLQLPVRLWLCTRAETATQIFLKFSVQDFHWKL